VSVHNVTWSATSSAVGSIKIIQDALDWLTGGHAEISHEKIKSYHGARMMMIHARILKKKNAKVSLAHLGENLLEELARLETLKTRIDNQNVLHLRLSLKSLVNGSIELSSGQEELVKGRIKLEVYPGQDPISNANEMLIRAIQIARENGFPLDPRAEKFR